MLTLKNLTVKVGQKEILHNLNFNFQKGKIYALMGPNGSGKSTLAWSIIGSPNYTLDKKSRILFEGKDITNLKTEKRAKKGIFLSFQNPPSLTGVNIYQLLSYALPKKVNLLKIKKRIETIAKKITLNEDILERAFYPGLSGGEKKKVEVLQAIILNPRFAIFDEIDTGLDIDAVKRISEVLREYKKNKTFLLITHYSRILKYLQPDYVLVMKEGKIVKSGGKDLAEKIEKEGYQNL